MSAHLGKIALMVVMTHGLRSLGRRVSPRWAGLALGLPCSTAVALVGGGVDRGVDYAVVMSGTSLVGLAGAVALPMAYALALLRGWRLYRAIGLGVASYLFVALSVGRLLPGRGDASLVVALLAVVAAALLARRMSVGDGAEPNRDRPQRAISTQLLRTLVPIACLMAALGMGELFGAEVAGLMSTFPGVTLTVLCLTHIEAGPISAVRMARALPAGNLGMVAFLAAFRFGSPAFGLAWGTLLGYSASLVILALVVCSDCWIGWVEQALARLKGASEPRNRVCSAIPRESYRLSILDRLGRLNPALRKKAGNPVFLIRPPWPRECRRFSPSLESFTS